MIRKRRYILQKVLHPHVHYHWHWKRSLERIQNTSEELQGHLEKRIAVLDLLQEHAFGRGRLFLYSKMTEKIKFHVNLKKRTIIVDLEHKRLLYATKELKGVWHCCFVLGVSDLA